MNATFKNFINEVGVIIITPHGRAGSLFVHGLFDGLPNVIVPPFFLNEYDTNYSSMSIENNIEKFIEINKNLFLSEQILKIKSSNFILLSKSFFKEKMVQLLKNNEVPINRKSIVLSFFYVYADLLKIDHNKITHILLHLHFYNYPDPSVLSTNQHLSLYADFKNFLYIALVQCPILSMLSYLKKKENFSNFVYHLAYIKFSFSNLHLLIDKVDPSRIHVIDIGEINKTKGEVLKNLLKKEGILINQNFGRSTFQGIEWTGISENNKLSNTFDLEIEKNNLDLLGKLSINSRLYSYLYLTEKALSPSDLAYQKFFFKRFSFVSFVSHYFNEIKTHYSVIQNSRFKSHHSFWIRILHKYYFYAERVFLDIKIFIKAYNS